MRLIVSVCLASERTSAAGQTQGQQGRGQQQGRENTGYKGKNSMTDDMVYERFKKRARR